MNSPLLVLDQNSPLPPYEQICMQIRLQIAAGRLPPIMLLPSVRQLARDLGVAPNTVVRAYSELEREGWVASSARRGIRVAEQPPGIPLEERQRQLERAVQQLLVTAHQLGVTVADLHAEIDRQRGHTR